LDPEMLNRFITMNYSEEDLHGLRMMFKNEAYDYVVQWMQDPANWRASNPDSFPLDI